MSLLILSVSHFLHLLATVVWIGGIVILLTVILPGARAALAAPPAVGGLMKEITKRFTPVANISILVLIVTGVVIARYDQDLRGVPESSHPWGIVMPLKHLAVGLMIVVHFYRGLVLNPKIAKLSSPVAEAQTSPTPSSPVAALQKLSLNLVRANLVLGIMVLLLTAVSSSL